MTQEHPITPPPEVVQQWLDTWYDLPAQRPAFNNWITTQAARWGADQELEACCEWLVADHWKAVSENLRDARRPKPPSLKEQALEALERMDQLPTFEDQSVIRRALEALPDV